MANASAPLKLFLSYSHVDKAMLAEFEAHTASIRRDHLIVTWNDRKIVPGKTWEAEIDDALLSADIVVFLLTSDFVQSEYCMGKEVAVALERHDAGQAIVIPIVARPVDWLSTPMSKLQALPSGGKAISTWTNADEAWLDVALGIRAAASELRQRRAIVPQKPLYVTLGKALIEEVDRIEDLYNRSDSASVGGLATGLRDLDLCIDGLHRGDMVLVASAPVMDRLGLLLSIASFALVESGLPGLVFSLRHSRQKVVTRLVSAFGRMSAHRLMQGSLAAADWELLSLALSKMQEANLAVVDTPYIDVANVIYQIDQFKQQCGSCALVIIDSFEKVQSDDRALVIPTLSQYARATGTPIVLGGGLERDPSIRPNKRPVIQDIREWAALYEEFDVVTFLYQDEQYDPDSADRGIAEIIIAKNLHGPIGTVRVEYLREQQAFGSITN